MWYLTIGVMNMFKFLKKKINPPQKKTYQSLNVSEEFLFTEERVSQAQSNINIHSMRIYQMALYPESITEDEQYVLDHDMFIQRTYQKYVDIIKEKGY